VFFAGCNSMRGDDVGVCCCQLLRTCRKGRLDALACCYPGVQAETGQTGGPGHPAPPHVSGLCRALQHPVCPAHMNMVRIALKVMVHHCRQTRLGRVKPEQLAAANANNMLAAAHSFIRSRSGVTESGWVTAAAAGTSSSPAGIQSAHLTAQPALVCFDELQVSCACNAAGRYE
jgi:hypothetical protein